METKINNSKQNNASIRFITKAEMEALSVGSLCFPGDYSDITRYLDRRKSKVKNITKMFAKVYEQEDILSGGLPALNTDITYNTTPFCESTWEGAFPIDFMGETCYVSRHPHGEVLIYSKKR